MRYSDIDSVMNLKSILRYVYTYIIHIWHIFFIIGSEMPTIFYYVFM